MIVLAIVENTPDPTLPLSNGEVILPWVYGIVSVFAAIFVAVTAFVIYFRQEPEIVSRNVLFITQIGPWGLLMVVSAVTLRLRVIYKIWICNDLNTSYGFGLIYHIPISIVSVAVPCAIRSWGDKQENIGLRQLTYREWPMKFKAIVFQALASYYLIHSCMKDLYGSVNAVWLETS
eukprot:CFRG0664T1